LINTWKSRGHSIIAAAPGITPSIRFQLSQIGARAAECPIYRTKKNPFSDIGSIYSLLRLFKRFQPDYFFGYTIKPVIYGSIAAHLAGIPSIFSMVTGLGRLFNNRPRKTNLLNMLLLHLYRFAISHNNGILFQNPEDESLFKRLRITKPDATTTVVNGSGINTESFIQKPLPDDISFILAARLIEEKGVRYYYRAAKQLKQRYPQTKFLVAGWIDGSETSISAREFQKWIEEGILEYLGHLADIRPALERSSVFVLPTFYREGVPRSILEAMATGRPIITTDTPGCRSTVLPYVNGILIRPKNEPDLALAMQYFLENPHDVEKMGHASRRLAKEKFDVHTINRHICAFMGL
jgi:glycosyltransferase involved in cell wall biosynthesis